MFALSLLILVFPCRLIVVLLLLGRKVFGGDLIELCCQRCFEVFGVGYWRYSLWNTVLIARVEFLDSLSIFEVALLSLWYILSFLIRRHVLRYSFLCRARSGDDVLFFIFIFSSSGIGCC